MALERLILRIVEKPWGRIDLPSWLGDRADGSTRIGEVWFEREGDKPAPLLVKYLFTSEKLSVQVHPADAQAQAAGFPFGKDEAWYVLSAEPGATIGLGLREEVDLEELRSAALDGRIEQLVDWRDVRAGDAYYSPAGTVHAIGPGLTLVEIQQNCDVTYRLFDYGRPRELHLDQALDVLEASSRPPRSEPQPIADGRELIATGDRLRVERWTSGGQLSAEAERPAWLVPIAGEASVASDRLRPGEAWLATSGCEVSLTQASELLVATLA